MTTLYLARGSTGEAAARLAQETAFVRAGLPPEPTIQRTVLGKPYLPDWPLVQYNLSHSGPWGACAISEAAVGVDLELVRPLRRDVARRFFTPTEQRYLDQRPPEEFFRLWTRKESFTKALGKGLTLPLNSFSVLEDQLYREGLVWYFYEYPLEGGYLTLCCQQPQAELVPLAQPDK